MHRGTRKLPLDDKLITTDTHGYLPVPCMVCPAIVCEKDAQSFVPIMDGAMQVILPKDSTPQQLGVVRLLMQSFKSCQPSFKVLHAGKHAIIPCLDVAFSTSNLHNMSSFCIHPGYRGRGSNNWNTESLERQLAQSCTPGVPGVAGGADEAGT
jgi:hypothetical protein